MKKPSASAMIKEIFSSIQGEGLYVGQMQTFVRFCGCNLVCAYCDTDFTDNDAMAYTIDELYEEVKEAAAMSLTGGEPLLHADFLLEFFEKYKNLKNPLGPLGQIHLETNGTLPFELLKIVDYIDTIAVDIKLESATGQEFSPSTLEMFLARCARKAFLKAVFDKNILDDEITMCAKMAQEFDIPLIIQPKMPLDAPFEDIFRKFHAKNPATRLIPQMHKFLKVR